MLRARFLSPATLSVELAHSDARAAAPCFSADQRALFVPLLRASPNVLRRVAHGDSLYRQFLACVLVEEYGEEARTSVRPWSYVWGDLLMFTNGEPLIQRCIFVQGTYTRPDLREVQRYLQEFKNTPQLRLSAREEILHVTDPLQADG